MMQPAKSVPVVPNFTQGSMTSHTETTSKVTETINSIDYATGWQYSVSGTNVSNNGASLLPPNNNKHSGCNSKGGIEGQVTSSATGLDFSNSNFTITNPGAGISVHDDLSRARDYKPNCDPKNNRRYKRNRYHKYLYPVSVYSPPSSAADVGGVSATANPIANSSGSVTNQAIQVLQGPYITNTYGGNGISCQGPTLLTSLLTSLMQLMIRIHLKLRYMEPQYDARDFEGKTGRSHKE